ncbi:hypothetical protein M8818_007682 [Zalaria obscura]|uniref:Uncharacterized protein n=1 Tax=Zalaria obscura TaxID=2024903 RepID=A0ACC3S302_9PEZI
MSEEPTTEAYNHTHRAFLQAFLSHPTLTLPTARPILAAILTAASPSRPTLPADITDADFQSYIAAINASLSPLDYEIRSTRDQKDRSAVLIWALVNTTSDGLTQLATTYSADEIAFVKRVLDAMFETNNTARAEIMAVTGMQALKLHRAAGGVRAAQVDGDGEQTQGSAGQGLTMAAAERVLASLVQEGWFERSKSGFYSLSPRALMELRGWLIETYNEPAGEEEDEVEVVRIRVCQACREIVTVGQRCPNMDCGCRLHDFCTRNIFRVEGAERCPLCKTAWDDQHPVGEKAARAGARRSSGNASRRTTMQTDGADESEDDG